MAKVLASLGAVVLCGGESRRMGRPKAWLPFGPERMLQRVVRLGGNCLGRSLWLLPQVKSSPN